MKDAPAARAPADLPVPPAPGPGRRGTAVGLAAAAAWAVVLGALYVRVPASPDSAVFDYVGWRLLQGARLYVDVSEQNFPGQMWLHAASTALFGNHLWSYRAFDWGVTLLGAGVLAGLLARAGARAAALLVLALYPTVVATANLWVSGQRDLVAALFLTAAGLAWRLRGDGGGRAWLLPFAGLLAFAVLVRPTYAAFGPALAGLELLRTAGDRPRARRALGDALLAGALCALLLGAVAAAGWRSGALSGWYELAVLFNVEVYGRTQTLGQISRSFLDMVVSWHWYLAFGIWGGVRWWREGRDRGVLDVLLAIAVTGVASAYVQRKGFGYHLAALLPVLSALAAHLVASSVARARAAPTPARTGIALVLCAVAVAGTAKKIGTELRPQLELRAGARTERSLLARYDAGPAGFSLADAVDAADYVRRTTPEAATVLTWSRAVQVNFLAERASPSRFSTVGVLGLAREPFSRAGAWTEELARIFRERPPEIVLVPAPGAAEDPEEVFLQASPSGPVLALRAALERRYARERAFGTMELYRLRDRGAR